MCKLPLEHKIANEQTSTRELSRAYLTVPERETKVTEAKMSLAAKEEYTGWEDMELRQSKTSGGNEWLGVELVTT